MKRVNITQLKAQVVDYLTNNGSLGAVRVLGAFGAVEREFPLKRPVVAVGLDAVELAPAGLGGYWGESAADALYGSGATIALRFDLYCPPDKGADGLHGIYEALCDRLMLRGNPFGVLRLSCGEVSFDRAASVNRLTVKAVLRAAVLLRDEEAPIGRIDVIRKDGEQ